MRKEKIRAFESDKPRVTENVIPQVSRTRPGEKRTITAGKEKRKEKRKKGYLPPAGIGKPKRKKRHVFPSGL